MYGIEWIEANWHVSPDEDQIWNGERVYGGNTPNVFYDTPLFT